MYSANFQKSSLSDKPAPQALEEEPARLACLDIMLLPLQILAHRDADVLTLPAVVVSEDRPQGIILQANKLAREQQILPGMRYAAARGLVPDLRAGVVSEQEIAQTVLQIAEMLRQLSPSVEMSQLEPGVFWLDASGFDGLYGSPQHWARAVRQGLLQQKWHTAIALGFEKFALYAIARHFRGIRMAQSPQHERQIARQVALASLGPLLGLPPAARDMLLRLGIENLGQLVDLPPLGLRERLGETVYALHRRARGEEVAPLRPDRAEQPLQTEKVLEPADDNAQRLLFLFKSMLDDLLLETAQKRQAVAAVHLRLTLELPYGDRQRDVAQDQAQHQVIQSELRPAEPSLDARQLTDLIRLHLEVLQLPAKAERLHLQLENVPATAVQLRMWQLLASSSSPAKRDRQAATLALTRLRAAYGEEAVVVALLRPFHLPEAQFTWQPLKTMPQYHKPKDATNSAEKKMLPLVRRLLAEPQALPPRPKREPDGWLLSDWRQGKVVRHWGPFRLTGGWWQKEVKRDDYYVETERGDWIWLSYDAVRRGWIVRGTVD